MVAPKLIVAAFAIVASAAFGSPTIVAEKEPLKAVPVLRIDPSTLDLNKVTKDDIIRTLVHQKQLLEEAYQENVDTLQANLDSALMTNRAAFTEVERMQGIVNEQAERIDAQRDAIMEMEIRYLFLKRLCTALGAGLVGALAFWLVSRAGLMLPYGWIAIPASMAGVGAILQIIL